MAVIYDRGPLYKLVEANTVEVIEVGMRRKTSRGEIVTVSGLQPPRYAGSNGRVYVVSYTADGPANGWTAEYYPSVIGAKIVER